jgi:hypothetical protein
MNYQDAIKKINRLLGLYDFNSYKIAETGEELISEGELTVGNDIYVITDNGQLPAPDGEYELEDTTKIKIEDGKVKELKYDMENESLNFTEATMKDGTVLKSPTFDLGEDVSVVGTDGKETPAPDGEHEIALKDSEGNEVTIRIMTKDGKITERENVEESNPEMPENGEEMGMVPDLSIGNDVTDESFKKSIMEKIDTMMAKMEEMASNYEDMKAKVAKFSKEPAGEPVKQAKNVINEFNSAKNDYISQLVNVRRKSYTK